VILLLVVVSFLAGRAVEHSLNGYKYTLLKEEVYDSPLGPIQGHERFKFELIGSGQTSLTVNDQVLIYEAKGGWLDNGFWAREVRYEDGQIRWEDGVYTYALTMTELPYPDPVEDN